LRRRRPHGRVSQALLAPDASHFRLRIAAGHVDPAVLVDEDVHLTADAEFRQIDSRLDGKAGAGHYATLLVRLEVIHVRAVAARLLADQMARAVDKVIAVAGALDHLAARLIDLPALQFLALRKCVADPLDRGVPRGGYDLEDLRVLFRHR